MKTLKNQIIDGPHGKPILVDAFFNKNENAKPVVIFSHGFKGFKDWGHFNKVAEIFADAGFAFVKFNFSHNGTTADDPENFGDLEAFGNNNYSIELDDLGKVIDEVEAGNIIPEDEINTKNIYLLGHSRGGGITILKAAEDKRVKKLATWSAVSKIGGRRSEEEMKKWEEEGVIYIPNSRTGQQMPMYWQIIEDYRENQDRLNIENACKQIDQPYLIVHGTADETVHVSEAKDINQWCESSKLKLVDGAGHTFGAGHPFEDDDLPAHAKKALDAVVEFFR